MATSTILLAHLRHRRVLLRRRVVGVDGAVPCLPVVAVARAAEQAAALARAVAPRVRERNVRPADREGGRRHERDLVRQPEARDQREVDRGGRHDRRQVGAVGLAERQQRRVAMWAEDDGRVRDEAEGDARGVRDRPAKRGHPPRVWWQHEREHPVDGQLHAVARRARQDKEEEARGRAPADDAGLRERPARQAGAARLVAVLDRHGGVGRLGCGRLLARGASNSGRARARARALATEVPKGRE